MSITVYGEKHRSHTLVNVILSVCTQFNFNMAHQNSKNYKKNIPLMIMMIMMITITVIFTALSLYGLTPQIIPI